ncbi:hypothetical protein [Mycobacterium sp.]|nr:hypothetical protein [Mycobacterium sp.]HME46854.1 hypothetical protein [Mycobacterium sp.]
MSEPEAMPGDVRCIRADGAGEMARLGRRVPADLAEEAVNSELLRARLGT